MCRRFDSARSHTYSKALYRSIFRGARLFFFKKYNLPLIFSGKNPDYITGMLAISGNHSFIKGASL